MMTSSPRSTHCERLLSGTYEAMARVMSCGAMPKYSPTAMAAQALVKLYSPLKEVENSAEEKRPVTLGSDEIISMATSARWPCEEKDIATDTLAALHLQRIVRPDKGHPVVFPQEIVQFGFGPDHAFHSAESLQVRAAEIGDVAIIRTGNGAQIADLMRMGSPHFHYGKLVAGAQREQRERNADVVVQVTLRGTHFKAAGKHPT